MESDDGERISTWREHHGNVAVWKDDRGSTLWKYDNNHENVDKRTVTGAESSSSCGQLLKTLMWRDRRRNENARLDGTSQCHRAIWRERERDRFVGCHYTRKKNIHAQFAQNLRSQPFNRDRRELGKKEQMFSQKFTNSSATLHPYLRRPSFLTDNVQMLPIATTLDHKELENRLMLSQEFLQVL